MEGGNQSPSPGSRRLSEFSVRVNGETTQAPPKGSAVPFTHDRFTTPIPKSNGDNAPVKLCGPSLGASAGGRVDWASSSLLDDKDYVRRAGWNDRDGRVGIQDGTILPASVGCSCSFRSTRLDESIGSIRCFDRECGNVPNVGSDVVT